MRALTPESIFSKLRLSTLTALLLAPMVTFTNVPPAMAQGMFSPAITVNDSVISHYELDQRVRLLEAFNTPGDLRALAREQLIDDRLRAQVLDRAGLSLGEAALAAELEAFAGRADLSYAQFTAQLAQVGIDEATLRDFVRIGASWREYVRSRFGNRTQITEADIDAALAQAGPPRSAIEVLLSEIIIAAPPQLAAAAQAEAERISRMTSTAAFEEAARQFSALPSRERGGRLDWLPIANYPAGLRALLLDLAPGEVTPPIPIENGVALFQKRGVREAAQAVPEAAFLDYAAFYIPGGLSETALREAQTLAARVDTCDDLYGIAQGLPQEQLQRETVAPSELPQDVALELAKLDAGEVSHTITRNDGQTLVFLMLCTRSGLTEDAVDRDAIRNQLRGQRLAGFADVLIAELRDAAIIR